MTLVELNYLLALAREGHFGRAAQSCHVSQPTLSVAIHKLESQLGIKLFERHKGDVRITEIGERLVQQAKRVLEEAEKFKQIATGSQHQLDTPLRLGGIYTVAPYLFPALIPALKKRAPNMGLIIHEDFTSRLREKLKRGDLDAIFIALPFTEPSVVVKPLYEEPFMLLLPKDHELVKKEAIEKNDLKKEKTLLLGVGHCFRDQILKDFPQCYNPDDAQQTVEGASLETLRHMVASGLGVTILPSTATQIKHYSTTLCVRPFKGSVPKRVIALAWRASFPRTQAIDALIKAFEKAKLSMTCPIG